MIGHKVNSRVMQLRRTLIVALVLVGEVFAQIPEDGFPSKIRAIHYAPLAEQARIQGDVHLHVKSGAVTLLSGHPLLAQISVESAKAFGAIQDETNLDVTYHFVLVDNASSVPTSMTVPKGNEFERALLRMFGFKTEKVVIEYRCQEGVPPANNFKIAGPLIEVWIYGRIRCPQISESSVAGDP